MEVNFLAVFAYSYVALILVSHFFRGTRLPIPQGLRSFFSNGWNQLIVILSLAGIDSLYDLSGLDEPDFSSLFSFLLQLGGRFMLFLFIGGLIGFAIYRIETKDEE